MKRSKRWANDSAQAVRPKDVYERITEKIIADLEKGVVPWLKPWDAKKAIDLDPNVIWPRNGSSGHWYSGCNVFALWGHMYDIKKQDERALFLTYNQCKSLGGHIRRGEKGCIVLGYRKGEREVENDEGDVEKKSFLTAFGHHVFHVSQCEGVKLPKFDNKQALQLVGLTDDNAWQAFVAALKVDLRHGGHRAYYSPFEDYVRMPPAKSFKGEHQYKAVALHEFTHWTGHKKRLDRDQSGFNGNETYAFEELVAELGAAFLCAKLGIVHKELRHAEYINTWLGVLKRDTKAVVRAASKATAAAKYIEELAKETMNAHCKDSARHTARNRAHHKTDPRKGQHSARGNGQAKAEGLAKVKGKASHHVRPAARRADQSRVRAGAPIRPTKTDRAIRKAR
jgi:antirestriction protein ArdC